MDNTRYHKILVGNHVLRAHWKIRQSQGARAQPRFEGRNVNALGEPASAAPLQVGRENELFFCFTMKFMVYKSMALVHNARGRVRCFLGPWAPSPLFSGT
jgi:hypothetical protein